MAVMFVFLFNRSVVVSPAANFSQASYFTVSQSAPLITPFVFQLNFRGVVSSFPLIIFAYMYQVNIPMIYFELEKRNSKQMGKVLMGGTFSAVLLYALTGIFGFFTFVNFNDYSAFDALKAQNILEAPYANVKAITIGNFSLF